FCGRPWIRPEAKVNRPPFGCTTSGTECRDDSVEVDISSPEGHMYGRSRRTRVAFVESSVGVEQMNMDDGPLQGCEELDLSTRKCAATVHVTSSYICDRMSVCC